jgi:hypothetical protein
MVEPNEDGASQLEFMHLWASRSENLLQDRHDPQSGECRSLMVNVIDVYRQVYKTR